MILNLTLDIPTNSSMPYLIANSPNYPLFKSISKDFSLSFLNSNTPIKIFIQFTNSISINLLYHKNFYREVPSQNLDSIGTRHCYISYRLHSFIYNIIPISILLRKNIFFPNRNEKWFLYSIFNQYVLYQLYKKVLPINVWPVIV